MSYFDYMNQYGAAPGGMWSNFNFTFNPSSTTASTSTEASEELSGSGSTDGDMSGYFNENGEIDWSKVDFSKMSAAQITALIEAEKTKKEAIEKARKAEEENKKLLLAQCDTTAVKNVTNVVQKTEASIEKSKKADGTAFKKDIELEPPKKQTLWGKIKNWGKNTWKACEKVWDGMTKDENGNWSLKKCLKSAATVAAVWVLPRVVDVFVPGAGVAITTGLIAAGVGTGLYETVTGGIDLNGAEKRYAAAYRKYESATTPEAKEAALQEALKAKEEIDKAQQKTSMGLIVGTTSLFGMRGLGRAARAGAAASGTGTAASAARTTEQVAQAVRSQGYKMATGPGSGVKNFFYDTTVNAMKGTRAQMSATRAAAGQGWKARWNDAWGKSKDLYTNGAKFDKTEGALGDGIKRSLTDMERHMERANFEALARKVQAGTATDTEKLTFEALNNAFSSMEQEIIGFGTTTMSKAEYAELIAQGGSKGISAVEKAIDDLKVLRDLVTNPAERATVETQISNLQQVLKGTYKANLGKLVNLKDANMKYMADNASRFGTELETYMPGLEKPSGYWNWGKNQYQVEYLNNGWTRNRWYMKPMKYLKPAKWAMWDAPLIPMNLAQRPVGTAWKIYECGPYGKNFYSPLGDYIAKDEVDFELNTKKAWREKAEENIAIIEKVKSGEDKTTTAQELQTLIEETNQYAQLMQLDYNSYLAMVQQQQAEQQQAMQQQMATPQAGYENVG